MERLERLHREDDCRKERERREIEAEQRYFDRVKQFNT